MTMIELCIVMGIVTVLLALVLGLSRHVNEIVKIRTAQADLGEWHETLNAWFFEFGEYPYTVIDTANSSPSAPSLNDNLLDNNNPLNNLSNLLERCEVRFNLSGTTTTNITFSSHKTSNVNITDPWGTPYVYQPSDNGKAYTLFSCGPNAKTEGIPTGTPSSPDPTLDDVYFER